jgi:hypothetical protein
MGSCRLIPDLGQGFTKTPMPQLDSWAHRELQHEVNQKSLSGIDVHPD